MGMFHVKQYRQRAEGKPYKIIIKIIKNEFDTNKAAKLAYQQSEL